MLHNNDIAAGQASFVSNIYTRPCNILNAFSRNGKEDIAVFKVLFPTNYCFICMRNALIKPYVIGSIYLTITDAWSSFFGYLVTSNP